MENRIKVRHGSAAPKTGDLLPNELGFDESGKNLYIGVDEAAPLIVGRPIKSGVVNPMNDFSFRESPDVSNIYMEIDDSIPPSRKNLLQNWDFRYQPVNTGGATVYTIGAGETGPIDCIDRWRIKQLEDSTTQMRLATNTDGGGNIHKAVAFQKGYFYQPTEPISNKIYPYVTLSFFVDSLYINDTFHIYIKTDTKVYQSQEYTVGRGGIFTFTIPHPIKGITEVGIKCLQSALQLCCAKLECGLHSTLQYDAPAEYWEEKMKCSAYSAAWEDS